MSLTGNWKDRKVKRQWNDAADAWADFVRTGKDWTREWLNNPAMFRMLGPIRGKRILDLGCGEGHNSRLMARKGARVTGADFSKEMVALAVEKEKKNKLGIAYLVSDAAILTSFEDGSFDIVASFMALHDVEDYRGAIKEANRVLKRNGRFVFAICHPCFEVRILDGKRTGGWVYRETPGRSKSRGTTYWTSDKKSEDALYYTVDKYFDTRSDEIDWNFERLTKHFVTTSFHRTLTDYADALNRAGFLISRLDEPRPTKKGLAKHPDYFGGNLRIPHSIIVEAVKRREAIKGRIL